MRVILASSSPRRKELLKLLVKNFEIMPSDEEEILEEDLSPKEQVKHLAYIKAKSIYNKTSGDRIIIGADTIVVKNNKIYGKPKNKENAKQIIKELLEGDRTHKVITGLTVLIEENGIHKEYKQIDEVKIYFKEMQDKEIEKWIKTGKALDKAGAYAIQEEFCVHIEKIEGNSHTAIGLPTQKLYDIIKEYID